MHSATTTTDLPYGIVAEFDKPEDLLYAATRAKEAGYTKMDAYTPFPVHGLSEAIGFEDAKVPWTVFICGCLGAFGGMYMQYYVSAVDYPLNVGGKPLASWPSFIPVTFECTILLAAFGAVFGMLIMNQLPMPHHPIFNARHFERATLDRFFLCIESRDPQFDRERTRSFMAGLEPLDVSEVEDTHDEY